MSADNYTYCPKCDLQRENEIDHANEVVLYKYGEISKDEYLDAMFKVQNPPSRKETLREDYEIGIWDGGFLVKYSASCDECDFTFSYRYTKNSLLTE